MNKNLVKYSRLFPLQQGFQIKTVLLNKESILVSLGEKTSNEQ